MLILRELGRLQVAKYLPHFERALILLLSVHETIIVVLRFLDQRIIYVEQVGIDTASVQFLELIFRLMWTFPLVGLRLGLLVLLTSARFAGALTPRDSGLRARLSGVPRLSGLPGVVRVPRLASLRGATRLVALTIVGVVSSRATLPVSCKIESLFLVIPTSSRIWVILVQKILKLSQDVLTLVLHDQVLLL